MRRALGLVCLIFMGCSLTSPPPQTSPHPPATSPDPALVVPGVYTPRGAASVSLSDATSFPRHDDPERLRKVRISFHGDSIFHGFGLGEFDHPSPINAVWRILSELIAVDEVEVRVGAQSVEAIANEVVREEFGDGDIVIFENAGPHYNHAEYYETWLKLVHHAVTWNPRKAKTVSTTFLLTTMFDYPPFPSDIYHPSEYSTPVEGGRSINQVIVDFARTNGLGLIDFKRLMDRARQSESGLKLRFVLPDGIHATVFGNLVMSFAIYHYVFGVDAIFPHEALVAELQRMDAELKTRRIVQQDFDPAGYGSAVGAIDAIVRGEM